MTSLRSVLAALLSRWWVVLGAALLAGALSLLALQLVEQDPEQASVRVGLTSASVWPLYQADLESFANIVQRDDVRAEVESSIDGTLLDVETETVEGIFVVEVVAAANSSEVAVDAAAQFAMIGIAQQAADADGAKTQELDTLKDSLTDIEAQLATLETAETELREEARLLASQTDGEFSFEAEAVYRAADAEAARATAERNAVEQRRRSVTNQLEDLELRSSLSSERLFVVQDARPVQTSGAIDGPLPLIAAALAAAIAAGAWVVGTDRLRGPVRSVEQIERVLGLPVVAHMAAGVDGYGGQRLNTVLKSVGYHGTVELIVDAGASADVDELTDTLHDAADEADDDSERAGRFVIEPLDRAEAAVIVAESGASSVDSVARQARFLEMSQVRLVGVVLT